MRHWSWARRSWRKRCCRLDLLNKIIGSGPADSERFLEQVLEEVCERWGDHLNGESMLQVKALMRRPEREVMGDQTVAEVMSGLERFASGVAAGRVSKACQGTKEAQAVMLDAGTGRDDWRRL